MAIPILPGSSNVVGSAEASSLEQARALVLPVAALTLSLMGALIRHARASTVEALTHQSTLTAMAKGANKWRVLFRHVLPNASLPIITMVSLRFGALFSGALIIETVFGIPGVGKLLYDAMLASDFPLAMIALLFSGACVLVGTFIGDVLVMLRDPRIRKAV
jgi:peptide/nickel transport system permease protein